MVTLSNQAREDLAWWQTHAKYSGKCIHWPDVEVEFFTDASFKGYGIYHDGNSIARAWTSQDELFCEANINALEMMAVLHGVKALANILSEKSVCVRVDNTVAVSCINSMGSTHSPLCNTVSKMIWDQCISHKIQLKATHIAGKLNREADFASRNVDIEISITPHEFSQICKEFKIEPEIDLFASDKNHHLPIYAAWPCSAHASYIDAFTVD
jgi:ribonuclease HI